MDENDYPDPLILYNYSGGGVQKIYLNLSKAGRNSNFTIRNESSGRQIEIRPTFNGSAYTSQKLIVPPKAEFIGFYITNLKNSDGTTAPPQFSGAVSYIQVPNSQSNFFASVDEIPVDEIGANEIYFTSDLGVVETYFDEIEEEIKVRQLTGYNVPEQAQDIENLKVEADANRVITEYFKNESNLTVPYTQAHPIVEIYVLDTKQTIEGTSLTLLDTETGKYSGIYNAVGSISIYNNAWTTYSYHNAYKHNSQNYYVVFSQDIMSWVLLDTDTLHNYVFEDVGADQISLNHRGQLPQSYQNYDISMSIDNINSLEFIKAEANTRIDTENKIVVVDFGDSKPSGKVIIR